MRHRNSFNTNPETNYKDSVDISRTSRYDTSKNPISPQDAIDRFLDYKEQEIRSQTVSEYRRKLEYFKDFCSQKEIDNLNNLDGRLLSDYYHYRRNKSAHEPLSVKTMKDDMYLIRDFITFLKKIEAVAPDLPQKVRIPKMKQDEAVRDVKISSDRIEDILDYLETYEYATHNHVIWLFYTHTGRRPGGLYALDLGNLYLDREEPYIRFQHHPNETELKNGWKGETEIHIAKEVAAVFQDYIEQHRESVVTENGRTPFLTTSHGRMSRSTMRRSVYRFSRPCIINGQCPHNRDQSACEAKTCNDSASKCPSSKPPYALRHGYITAKLREGVPVKILGGRCDVSEEVIEKHYDERNMQEKRELRQQIFQEVQEEQDSQGYL